jgi:hypothetical protein
LKCALFRLRVVINHVLNRAACLAHAAGGAALLHVVQHRHLPPEFLLSLPRPLHIRPLT